jgi:hypothetical protein
MMTFEWMVSLRVADEPPNYEEITGIDATVESLTFIQPDQTTDRDAAGTWVSQHRAGRSSRSRL